MYFAPFSLGVNPYESPDIIDFEEITIISTYLFSMTVDRGRCLVAILMGWQTTTIEAYQ